MDIEKSLKDATDMLGNSSFNTLFVNPMYAALLTTAAIVLIIILIYDECRLPKTTFYIFCTTLAVLFMHNKLLLMEHRKQLCSKDELSICSGIGNGPTATGGDGVSALNYLKAF